MHEEDDDDDVQEAHEAMEAAVHVHYAVHGSDRVNVSIYRGNVLLGAELSRAEIGVLLYSLSNDLEGVSVSAGDVMVMVCAGLYLPKEAIEAGAPGTMASIAISYAGSDLLTAMMRQEHLMRLLRDGCSEFVSRRASEHPSKCN